MKKIYLVTPLLLGCLLGSGVVYAQEPPKELTEEDIKRLGAMVDNADKLFGSKKYEEALPIYQDIYNQTKEPTMLYRIALCYQNMEKHKEAVAGYKQFLAESPEDNAFRAKAQEAMVQEEAKIPKEEPKVEEPLKKPMKKSTFLYAGAGAAGVAGAIFGISGLRAAEAAKSDQIAGGGDIAEQQAKANKLGLISDLAFVAAIGAGVGGFMLSKKEKEQVTLLVGPTKIALSVEF